MSIEQLGPVNEAEENFYRESISLSMYATEVGCSPDIIEARIEGSVGEDGTVTGRDILACRDEAGEVWLPSFQFLLQEQTRIIFGRALQAVARDPYSSSYAQWWIKPNQDFGGDAPAMHLQGPDDGTTMTAIMYFFRVVNAPGHK